MTEVWSPVAMDAARPTAPPDADGVLNFWLRQVGPTGWFKGSADVDAEIVGRFAPIIADAARRDDHEWRATAGGAMALILLFDQFPRHVHRGSGAQFAYDPLALAIARDAIAGGFDALWPDPARLFLYLPFEHSERWEDQETACALIRERVVEPADALRHAEAHRDVIRRFGRFPHRNAVLGRTSTPDEVAFLEGGGYNPFAAAQRDRGALRAPPDERMVPTDRQ